MFGGSHSLWAVLKMLGRSQNLWAVLLMLGRSENFNIFSYFQDANIVILKHV